MFNKKIRTLLAVFGLLSIVGSASATSTSGSFTALTKSVLTVSGTDYVNTGATFGTAASFGDLSYFIGVDTSSWTSTVGFNYQGEDFNFSGLNTTADSITPLTLKGTKNEFTLSWTSKATPYSVGPFSGTSVNTGFSYSIAAVPEPETFAMFLAGLGIMGAVARRKKAQQA